MFLKQEKPEMDDFERKKNLVLKKKYLADADAKNAIFFAVLPQLSS